MTREDEETAAGWRRLRRCDKEKQCEVLGWIPEQQKKALGKKMGKPEGSSLVNSAVPMLL